MTKKSLLLPKENEDARRSAQEVVPNLSKKGLSARTASGKFSVPVEDKPSPVLGRFSDKATKPVKEPAKAPSSPLPGSLGTSSSSPRITESSSSSSSAFSFSSRTSLGRSGGLLIKPESSGSLRRGTPRPGDLKKTLSTVKFVLESSGLDQVEEDYEVA